MTRAKIRPPVELRQRARNQCVSCVMAQVLYVWGVTDRPNLTQVDKDAGRQKGKELSDPDAHFYLLKQGFTIVNIGPDDRDAFLRDGLAYLRRFHAKSWSAEHEEWFTPQRVAHYQRLTRRDIEREKRFEWSGKLRHEVRMPTLGTLKKFLRSGYVLDVTVRKDRRVQHAALVVPHAGHPDGSVAWVYNPQQSGQTTARHSLDRFVDALNLSNGIAAIKL